MIGAHQRKYDDIRVVNEYSIDEKLLSGLVIACIDGSIMVGCYVGSAEIMSSLIICFCRILRIKGQSHPGHTMDINDDHWVDH